MAPLLWALYISFAVVSMVVSVTETTPGAPVEPVSSAEEQALLQEYVERLLHHAQADNNDRRYHEYVKYINTFLSFFNHEEVIVAGSTAEKSKLRTDKYGGDADFVLISGVFNVSMSLLEPRWPNSRYVWIRGKTLRSFLPNVSLVEDKYLPTFLLKDVHPECFNILRGIFRMVTTTTNTIPEQSSRVVTTGEQMKVGLLRYTYRDLKLDKDILPPQSRIRRYPGEFKPNRRKIKGLIDGDESMSTWADFWMTIAQVSLPDSTGEHAGHFGRFAHILKLFFGERETESSNKPFEGKNRYLDADQDGKRQNPGVELRACQERDDGCPVKPNKKDRYVPATCSSYSSKDFVPAFRVTGKLSFLSDWAKRARKWPKERFVKQIIDSDIYIVARLAPVNGDPDRDFCLSFNRQEILLAKALNTVQRKCFLLLKAFHRGVLKDLAIKYDNLDATKLTTYHLKTAMFHVSERADPSLWGENNLKQAILTIVHFIIDALDTGILPHFFVGGNLFMGMQDDYRMEMKSAFENIQKDLLGSIQVFFSREDNFGDRPVKVRLNEEAIDGLLQVADDGGIMNEVGVVESAMEDFRRGFKLKPTSPGGRSPIDEAISRTVEVFLEHEKNEKLKKNKRQDG